MAPAITTHHLTKHFGDTVAVQALELAIAPGEIFGLIGPNGAGKTTLLQLLATLLVPSTGSATVLGYDIVRDALQLRPHIGYVSQTFTLYGTLSVEENIDFFAKLYGVPPAIREQRKASLLAWSRLGAFRTRRAAQLSGGMQKKLHLCCTLIHEPTLLLLDEPTTGVDPVSRQELWENLYDLVERGLTLIAATPYMDEAERCHRVALMDRGQVLHCDTPTTLQHMIHQTLWELRTDDWARLLPWLQERQWPWQRRGDVLRILLPAPIDLRAALQPFQERQPRAIFDLRRRPPSMEDVFIAVMTQAQPDTQTWQGESNGRQPRKKEAQELAVRLEGLTRTFGDFVAVDRLSLTVARGEIFGFLGPNGSGKTTTIKMLCGLLPPSAGHGEVLGYDIARHGQRIKARLGYMSQRFSLYNDLTVRENLAFFGGGYGLPSRRLTVRMAEVLQMTGLQGSERRRVHELSGGVKQRLALGCALLHKPDLLFLDEPTAGVDPLARREFWHLISILAMTGITIFVTTHYMDEAENCQRLGLLYEGRLVAVGSLQSLQDNVQPYTLFEVACAAPLQALRLLRQHLSHARVSLFGQRLHVLLQDSATAARIQPLLQTAGILCETPQLLPLSLEDLFVVLIEAQTQQREVQHG